MATGEKGEAALRVLNEFMQNAEENLVIVRNVMLNENEYEAKFEIGAGRGRRPFNRISVVNYTARKRTQLALPYNGKCRRLSSSSVSSRSSSSSSSSPSNSSSSTNSVQTKASAKFSEDEEKLMLIGMATSSHYSNE